MSDVSISGATETIPNIESTGFQANDEISLLMHFS